MAKRGVLWDCDICGMEMKSCYEDVGPANILEITVPEVYIADSKPHSTKILWVCHDCWESGFQIHFSSKCEKCNGSGYKLPPGHPYGPKPCGCGGPDEWASRRGVLGISKKMEAKCLTR